MMTPDEISALLGIDETGLADDINTIGHPARMAYKHGVAASARELRQGIRDAAQAGSPFSIAQSLQLIQRQLACMI